MRSKKRKPLGSAMEEFVFGTKEAAPPTPDVVSPAPQAFQAAQIPPTSIKPEAALLPVAKPPQPEASAPEPDGVTTPPETQTEQRVDRFMLKKDRRDESYTRPIRIYVTGIADLGYEGLNMQVRETSIYKTSGFSSYFFHTLIKQRHVT